jgi:hypothetical protein
MKRLPGVAVFAVGPGDRCDAVRRRIHNLVVETSLHSVARPVSAESSSVHLSSVLPFFLTMVCHHKNALP